MPIRIPLLFHLNQHASEYARVASLACYRGLLQVLRSHSALPVNIHISGTLIDALKWVDPEPLQLIWEGLRAGQFELLGSTYAQNVPYASDDWDNQKQIEMHLEVLHETFGVTPVTFWNPERAWRQSLLPIIAGNGYRFTLIEDHILAQARLAEPVVVTSQVGAHILTLLYDDHMLRHLFNFAVWFARPGQLQSYLMRRAEHPNASTHCLTYAEDAEAMGLWGWQEGVVPNQTWHRLDQVLTLMEALPEIELIHLTNAPASAGNLSPIPDGSASWMDESLREEGRPYHEPGYEDWFDFNSNSPKLKDFRVFFGEIRASLKENEKRFEGKKGSRTRAARRLFASALANYLAHQYEFGCIGIGGEGYAGWEGAQASWVLLCASQKAEEAENIAFADDVNHDDEIEHVLADSRRMIVTTHHGGRILYWFDLAEGLQHVGNQRAVPRAPYEADAKLPAIEPIPYAMWLPDDFRPQAFTPDGRLSAEAAPTRMGHYLPQWVWEGEREPFELLTRAIREPGSSTPMPVQRRVLTDSICLDGEEIESDHEFDADLSESRVRYRARLSPQVTLEKHISLAENGIDATYAWRNEGDEPVHVQWVVINELTPDYATLIEKGEKVARYLFEDGIAIVRNSQARVEIQIGSDLEPSAVRHRRGLMGIEVELEFELELTAGGEKSVQIGLVQASVPKSKKR